MFNVLIKCYFTREFGRAYLNNYRIYIVCIYMIHIWTSKSTDMQRTWN
eukprot:UN05986